MGISGEALFVAVLIKKLNNLVSADFALQGVEHSHILEGIVEHLVADGVVGSVLARVNDKAVATLQATTTVCDEIRVDWLVGKRSIIEVIAPLQKARNLVHIELYAKHPCSI